MRCSSSFDRKSRGDQDPYDDGEYRSVERHGGYISLCITSQPKRAHLAATKRA